MKPFTVFYDRSYAYSRAIVAMLVGLLLLFWPDVVARSIVIVIGALLTLIGIFSFVFACKKTEGESQSAILSANAVVDIVLGIVIMIFNQFFAGMVMFLFAAILLLFGILQLLSLIQTHRISKIQGRFYLAPIMTILCGLVIFFNPFSTLEWLFIFFGISLVIYAIGEFAATKKLRKIMKIQKESAFQDIEDV